MSLLDSCFFWKRLTCPPLVRRLRVSWRTVFGTSNFCPLLLKFALASIYLFDSVCYFWFDRLTRDEKASAHKDLLLFSLMRRGACSFEGSFLLLRLFHPTLSLYLIFSTQIANSKFAGVRGECEKSSRRSSFAVLFLSGFVLKLHRFFLSQGSALLIDAQRDGPPSQWDYHLSLMRFLQRCGSKFREANFLAVNQNVNRFIKREKFTCLVPIPPSTLESLCCSRRTRTWRGTCTNQW